MGPGAEDKNRARLAITTQLAAAAQRVRMFGTAALDLASVAEGKLDASIIMSNKPWDTAAGVLLAREAGAVVADTAGGTHTIHSAATITAVPAIMDAILTLVSAVTEHNQSQP